MLVFTDLAVQVQVDDTAIPGLDHCSGTNSSTTTASPFSTVHNMPRITNTTVLSRTQYVWACGPARDWSHRAVHVERQRCIVVCHTSVASLEIDRCELLQHHPFTVVEHAEALLTTVEISDDVTTAGDAPHITAVTKLRQFSPVEVEHLAR